MSGKKVIFFSFHGLLMVCILRIFKIGWFSSKKKKHNNKAEGIIYLSLICTCQKIKTVMNYTLLYKILLSETKFKCILLKIQKTNFLI